MRHALPISALLSLLLAACASTSATLPPKAVDQSGSLKVHPGLLGQPVPPELQPQDAPATGTATPPAAEEGTRGKAAEQRPGEARLPSEQSIYFDLNNAELKPQSAQALQPHVAYLAQHPKARVRIEGNADERGPADHNRKLAQRRADAVRQFLLGQGANASQIKAVSLGESNPRRKGHNEESWAENRRADIVYEKED